MQRRYRMICIVGIVSSLFITFPATGQDGSTLIEAVMNQDFDEAKELINTGIDVDYQDPSSGSTALLMACQYGFVDMAKFLIERNADLDLQAENGKTALMACAGVSEELFDYLLSKGADIHIADNNGTTAFTYACTGILRGKVPPSVVQTLLDKGADVNEAPSTGRNEGYTRLMMAARNNDPELVQLLAKNGADINKQAKDGKTALSLAVKKDHVEMVTLLKSLGAVEE